MTPTLVRERLSHAGSVPPGVNPCARARDWSEIQERMLVPLYEAVYERLEVGPATRLLGLHCGSGLALLMASSRGAAVTGVDSCRELLALARERLSPDATRGTRARTRPGTETATGRGGGTGPGAGRETGTRLVEDLPGHGAAAETPAYTLMT
ncbi:class I SAM-dependent methyltransferase, partial [Streptomyces sp. SAS_269]|uniref:class I SAM-dependent methyltransferase n=1 Tax=Streptomyces sp. SAS_269 TaxID=3412749 RepID=UPI00403D2899